MKYAYRHEFLYERCAVTEKPTPRLNHINDEKVSLNWSERILAIYCSAWSAFTVETYTIPQTDFEDDECDEDSEDYEDHDEYDELSLHSSFGQSMSTCLVNDFRQQFH